MFKYTIIKTRALEGYKMYQEAWLKENSRANKLELENAKLAERIEELDKVISSYKEDLKTKDNEMLSAIKTMDEMDREIAELRDEVEKPAKTNLAFADEVKAYRCEHNLTQAELAKMLNVKVVAISSWERGVSPSARNRRAFDTLLERL